MTFIKNINTLLAALKPSQYREYWKIWNEKFRDRYKEIFGDEYRIYLEYPKDKIDFSDYSDKFRKNLRGIQLFISNLNLKTNIKERDPAEFKIRSFEDYFRGYAYNDKGQKISIPKLIQKIVNMYNKIEDLSEEVKQHCLIRARDIYFNNNSETPEYENFSLDLHTTVILVAENLLKLYNQRPSYKELIKPKLVCISRHPYDIAGMSTDRRWKSCMRLPDSKDKYDKGGEYHKILKKDIEYGTLVAYLIYENDKNIKDPIARIAIKPYQNIEDPKDILLAPEPEVYSDNIKSTNTTFKNIVKNWVDELQNKKTGLFIFNKELYRDRSPKLLAKNIDENKIKELNNFKIDNYKEIFNKYFSYYIFVSDFKDAEVHFAHKNWLIISNGIINKFFFSNYHTPKMRLRFEDCIFNYGIIKGASFKKCEIKDVNILPLDSDESSDITTCKIYDGIIDSSIISDSVIYGGYYKNVKFYNCTINNSVIFSCDFELSTINDCVVIDYDEYSECISNGGEWYILFEDRYIKMHPENFYTLLKKHGSYEFLKHISKNNDVDFKVRRYFTKFKYKYSDYKKDVSLLQPVENIFKS